MKLDACGPKTLYAQNNCHPVVNRLNGTMQPDAYIP